MSRLVTNPIEVAVPELRTESRLREVERRLEELSRVEDRWHILGASGEPAFATGYRAYQTGTGTPGVTFALPQFRRINGVVYLRGIIEKSSAVVAGEAMFTLPVGYRPAKQAILVTISNSALSRVDVLSTGAVTIQIGNAIWISLDGCSFALE